MVGLRNYTNLRKVLSSDGHAFYHDLLVICPTTWLLNNFAVIFLQDGKTGKIDPSKTELLIYHEEIIRHLLRANHFKIISFYANLLERKVETRIKCKKLYLKFFLANFIQEFKRWITWNSRYCQQTSCCRR